MITRRRRRRRISCITHGCVCVCSTILRSSLLLRRTRGVGLRSRPAQTCSWATSVQTPNASLSVAPKLCGRMGARAAVRSEAGWGQIERSMNGETAIRWFILPANPFASHSLRTFCCVRCAVVVFCSHFPFHNALPPHGEGGRMDGAWQQQQHSTHKATHSRTA